MGKKDFNEENQIFESLMSSNKFNVLSKHKPKQNEGNGLFVLNRRSRITPTDPIVKPFQDIDFSPRSRSCKRMKETVKI